MKPIIAPPALEAALVIASACAPTRFAAASGLACDILLWSMTAVAIEKLQEKGITPGVLKSANFPGGADYNNEKLYPQYDKYGY